MSNADPLDVRLIAHRGYPTRYPENTMIGYRGAVDAGATWLETDVQLTSDRQPVLYHDNNLSRVSGADESPMELTFDQLKEYSAGCPERFGNRFQHEPIASLRELCYLMVNADHVQTFVEIKQDSIKTFGCDDVVRVVLATIKPVASRCVVISKDFDALLAVREQAGGRVGWVLSEWSSDLQDRARRLQPEFLICKSKRFPQDDSEIWIGPWDWVVYSIDDPLEVLQFARRGIRHVETDAIADLLTDERLTPGGQRKSL